jgi:hypothetical protein
MPETIRTTYDTVLNTLANLSGDRNMVAHDQFEHDPDGDGIRFWVIKAKGRWGLPDTRWSAKEVERKCSELTEIAEMLKRLRQDFRLSKVLTRLTSAGALPTQAQQEQEALYRALLRPQEPLGSSPPETTRKPSRKTPQRRAKKADQAE